MKLVISKHFKDNIFEIYDYIAQDSIKYAKDTVKNIYLYISKLKQSPYIGRYVPELSNNFRELIYKSYRIIYEVSESTNTVYIHFVVHGKRNFKKFYNSYIKNNFKVLSKKSID